MTVPFVVSNHPQQHRLVDQTRTSSFCVDGFDTLNHRVVRILKEFPETRNSDKLLLQRYYKHYEGIETKLDLVNKTPESVTRARRKVQELNPDLAAEPEFKAARDLLENNYRQYFGK